MTQTSAVYKYMERARHKEAGRVAVTVYVQAPFRPLVRELEAKLRSREKQPKKPPNVRGKRQ